MAADCRAFLKSERVPLIAGANPKSRVVNKARPTVKASTQPSTAMDALTLPNGRRSSCAVGEEIWLPPIAPAFRTREVTTNAMASPKAAANNERTRLSTRNWRMSCCREAPRAPRKAVSCLLDTARASCRLATFAQAMRSTAATEAMRINSGSAVVTGKMTLQRLDHHPAVFREGRHFDGIALCTRLEDGLRLRSAPVPG